MRCLPHGTTEGAGDGDDFGGGGMGFEEDATPVKLTLLERLEGLPDRRRRDEDPVPPRVRSRPRSRSQSRSRSKTFIIHSRTCMDHTIDRSKRWIDSKQHTVFIW